MKVNDSKRVKELEDENRRLGDIVAAIALDNAMLKTSPRGTPDRSTVAGTPSRSMRCFGVTRRRARRVVGQSRSTQRLEPPPRDEAKELRDWRRGIAQVRPRWGCRRSHHHQS